ncbi:hypothetical protein C0081_22695 [Cohaesibacter celericrescens]|uniref:Uncharacterized protein n=1 Tax=Cohaesibacter celericrescens TaxID=2067669 RepID=A0A2N5XKX3_9HYPH|nr:hypothetical protein C0081_22695 [Cohaesibacter celericrescens]
MAATFRSPPSVECNKQDLAASVLLHDEDSLIFVMPILPCTVGLYRLDGQGSSFFGNFPKPWRK